MECLRKFIPKNFNNLSEDSRIEVVKELANTLFKKLDLEEIPVFFIDNISTNNKKSQGAFMHYPPCIYINSFFIKSDKKEVRKEFPYIENLDTFLPYQLIFCIAHECYHYYQYNLTKKLVNNELTNKEDKDLAYIFFISLYNNLFERLNDKKNFSDIIKLDLDQLYIFSPAEKYANSYAREIVYKTLEYGTIKSDLDEFNNHQLYLVFNKLHFTSKNNLSEKNVIEYNLKLVLDLLKSKNAESGKIKYLGIDEVELENSVRNYISLINKNSFNTPHSNR